MALHVLIFFESFIVLSFEQLRSLDLAKHRWIESLANSLIIPIIQVFKNE